MPVKRSGANVIKDIEAIIKAVEQDADGIRTVVFNKVKGDLTRRIFNEGTATGGGLIGQYSPVTKKIRNSLGFRIDKVDLEITGTERRSIAVGVGDGKIVLGLQEQPEPKISVKGGRIQIKGDSKFTTVENAAHQEEHFGKEIFAPSKEEIESGEKTLIKELDSTVIKALGRS